MSRTAPTLESLNLDAAYADFKRLLTARTWAFVKRHGLDFDEGLSWAHEAFCKAFKNHVPEKGQFSTYLWWTLRSSLHEFLERERRHPAPQTLDIRRGDVELGSTDAEQVPNRPEHHPWAQDLSGDAVLVLRELTGEYRDLEPERKGPASLRRAAEEWLRQAGWSETRIKKAFREIEEALP